LSRIEWGKNKNMKKMLKLWTWYSRSPQTVYSAMCLPHQAYKCRRTLLAPVYTDLEKIFSLATASIIPSLSISS